MPTYNLGPCECCGEPCDGSGCGLNFMPLAISVDMTTSLCINTSNMFSFAAISLGPGTCIWEGRFESPNCVDDVRGDELLFQITFLPEQCRFSVKIMSVIHSGTSVTTDYCVTFLSSVIDPMGPPIVNFSFSAFVGTPWQPGNTDCGCCSTAGISGGSGSGTLFFG